MSFIAEVAVFHPDLPLTPTISTIADPTIKVESQPFTNPNTPSIFYAVSELDFQRFETALRDDRTVDDWRRPMELPNRRIYQIFPSEDAKFTTPKISSLGISVLSIQSAGQEWEFQLQSPDKDVLGKYWQYCRDEDVQFDLRKLYRSDPQDAMTNRSRLHAELTERQLEVAQTASRMGYYEEDGATAEEVASELGISPSTLSSHLRSILAKIFRSLF